MARDADKVVTSSLYSVESIFRAYSVLSVPVQPGIDSQEYHTLKIAKKNQIMVVGNNEPQKDLFTSVEVVSLINKKYRPKLVIASPRQTDMKQIIKLAKKMHVSLQLFVGLKQAEICKLYNQSKLTIALAHLEPFGLSVVESLACGTPVVAVNEAGFRETVLDGKTGVLVERDIMKISLAVEDLLKDKTKRDQMGKMGIKDVNTRYTWDNTVEKLEKIFYETKKKQKSPSSPLISTTAKLQRIVLTLLPISPKQILIWT